MGETASNPTKFKETKKIPKSLLVQYWFVPFVLVTIFLRQVVLVYANGLSPWKGGGFGMFSTVDRGNWRWIDIEGITTESKAIKIDVMSTDDPNLRKKINIARAVPRNQAFLQDIAQTVMNSKQLREDKTKGIYRLPNRNDLSPNPKESQAIQLQKIKIQVMHFHYDPHGNRIYYKPLFPALEVLKNE